MQLQPSLHCVRPTVRVRIRSWCTLSNMNMRCSRTWSCAREDLAKRASVRKCWAQGAPSRGGNSHSATAESFRTWCEGIGCWGAIVLQQCCRLCSSHDVQHVVKCEHVCSRISCRARKDPHEEEKRSKRLHHLLSATRTARHVCDRGTGSATVEVPVR